MPEFCKELYVKTIISTIIQNTPITYKEGIFSINNSKFHGLTCNSVVEIMKHFSKKNWKHYHSKQLIIQLRNFWITQE